MIHMNRRRYTGSVSAVIRKRGNRFAWGESKNRDGSKKPQLEKLSVVFYGISVSYTIVFVQLPSALRWVYSFFDYRPPKSLSDCAFVGIDWFRSMVSTPEKRLQLWEVLRNTFVMSGLGLLTSWMPMAFAILLSEIRNRHFKKAVQTLTTIPNFISWVLVYSMAFSLFSTSGMMNTFLQQLGILSKPVQFLQDNTHTWLSMWLWGQWKGLGWGAIMYLAAISGIDQELYEAARVDAPEDSGLSGTLPCRAFFPPSSYC